MQDGATALLWQPCAGLSVAAGCLSSLPIYRFTGGGLVQRHAESIEGLSIKDRRHLKS